MTVDLYEEGDSLFCWDERVWYRSGKNDVSVEGKNLRILVARKEEKGEKEKKEKQFYSKEICRGSFERTIRLPETVQEEKIEAEYKDGVLKITMPKLGEKKREKIKVLVKK